MESTSGEGARFNLLNSMNNIWRGGPRHPETTGGGIPDQSHQPKEPTGRPAEKWKRGQDHGPNPL